MAAVRMNFPPSGALFCNSGCFFLLGGVKDKSVPGKRQTDRHEHLVDELRLYPEVSELFQQQDGNRYPCVRSAGDWHSLSTEEMYA
jgi:hypothetical protein